MAIEHHDATDDVFGVQSYRVIKSADHGQGDEIRSEDGIFCAHCRARQGWDTATGNAVIKCTSCGLLFYCKAIHGITYASRSMRHLTAQGKR